MQNHTRCCNVVRSAANCPRNCVANLVLYDAQARQVRYIFGRNLQNCRANSCGSNRIRSEFISRSTGSTNDSFAFHFLAFSATTNSQSGNRTSNIKDALAAWWKRIMSFAVTITSSEWRARVVVVDFSGFRNDSRNSIATGIKQEVCGGCGGVRISRRFDRRLSVKNPNCCLHHQFNAKKGFSITINLT